MTTAVEALTVFAGGGAGAVARFAVNRAVVPLLPEIGFPWHTFAINVIGSAVLGVLVAVCKDRPTLLLLLGTGVCGGFTTFSTFSVEVVRLLEDNRPGLALLYAGSSVVAGVGAAYLAMAALGDEVMTRFPRNTPVTQGFGGAGVPPVSCRSRPAVRRPHQNQGKGE